MIGWDDPARARQELQTAGETVLSGGSGQLVVALRERMSAQINRLLVERGIGIAKLAPDDVSLESLFLALTRGPARDLRDRRQRAGRCGGPRLSLWELSRRELE